ncbi:hypothetical protein PRZ48_008009 [Zasmidium cellare]|uniref:Methyltransferase type 11 domain-containing protein n=1 Tax=Zasmidium cellare TaxID=395010 RepID=A0ABR0EFJ6_ZASCE|nr:hypothetical protein PRZ48_008009 [Zasmidium cellare]
MSGNTDAHHAHSYYDQQDDFWEKYRKGRHAPPQSFYSRIFDYHRQHGGKFGTIHDVGAGPGIHTAKIAQPFGKVLVSDIADSNVEVARSHLKDFDKPITFHVSKLEDVSWIVPESVDLVFAATVMHLTDLDKAMESFNRQLKPGGTLAIAVVGYSAWFNKRFQDAWGRMFQEACDKHWIRPRLKEDEATKKSAMSTIACSASAYDAVPLPTSFLEEGALRYKVNFPDEWSWYKIHISDESEKYVPLWSQIGETDKVIYEKADGWDIEVDFAGLEEIANSFPSSLSDREKWGEYWKVFEEVIGDGKIKGVWPHVMILATKKR